MNIKDHMFDRTIEIFDVRDAISRHENYKSILKGCEWCARIKYSKTCECVLNAEARAIARRFM